MEKGSVGTHLSTQYLNLYHSSGNTLLLLRLLALEMLAPASVGPTLQGFLGKHQLENLPH